jgi:hypothetical protein
MPAYPPFPCGTFGLVGILPSLPQVEILPIFQVGKFPNPYLKVYGIFTPEKRKMKIGYVSIGNTAVLSPASIHNYYKAKALRDAGLDVRFLGPLSWKKSPALFVRRVMNRLFTGRRILRNRDPSILRSFADQISHNLAENPVDVLFSDSTIPISLLRADRFLGRFHICRYA